MASIAELSTGRTRLLEPDHLIGRSAACSLRLEQRYVSAQHAGVRWTDDRWEIRDLGSRNGTFLDGVRLRAGDECPIRRSSRMAFGKQSHEWEIVDDSPPGVMLVPSDGDDPVVVEGDLLALPSSDEPLVTIYRTDGLWMLERPDESTTPLANSQTFELNGRSYRFCCSDNVSRTSFATLARPGMEVQHLQLSFSVSTDEEHVHLQMTCGGATFDMGTRGHNFLLLTLARQRIEDMAAGFPEGSCGWIYQEDLAHDPSMAPPQLNIDVFRLRRQFATVGVVDAAKIVERRPRTRQLRIGTGRLSEVRV